MDSRELEALDPVRYPFDLKNLPTDGIYFFYEKGENWGHGSVRPRIVRVGTSRDGNFRSRIDEHFLISNERSKMNFDKSKPAPHDRSIFRKNVGRTLLQRDDQGYLNVWNRDFMSHQIKVEHGNERDVEKEKTLEMRITRILRESFEFKFIEVIGQAERMNSSGLESRLIGTLAHCTKCGPSAAWLGNHSPVEKIRDSGLWLAQRLELRPNN